MDETRQLAEFITRVSYNDLNGEIIDKAKDLVLDQLGCELACSTLPWSRAVYKYIRDKKGGREESTVVNYGLRTIAEDAVFANATFGHGFEIDDSEVISVLHPGCVIIPPALAIGEREMISGQEFLTAMVVGYDISIRVGAGMRLPDARGFHPTPILGPFGAAAATAKILGLDVDKVLSSLAIAASESAGLLEYTEAGGSVKRLHAGMASQGGTRAALLAQRGLTGPPTILEGKKGFYRAYANEPSLKEVTADLGEDFRILWTGTKPYACCAGQHSSIDAVSKIVKEHNIKPEQIEEITLGLLEHHVAIAAAIIEPQETTGAQFSGAFGIALRLIKGGNQFSDYTEDNLRDPEILNIARKVKIIVDKELESLPRVKGERPAKVTLKLKDGTIYKERVNAAKGTILNPMTKEELHSKFRDLASRVLPDKQVENIIQTVGELEKLDNVFKLGVLLTAQPS
ncbi:MmgE/PrpD family protein [Chloroflexota bacterium]